MPCNVRPKREGRTRRAAGTGLSGYRFDGRRSIRAGCVRRLADIPRKHIRAGLNGQMCRLRVSLTECYRLTDEATSKVLRQV